MEEQTGWMPQLVGRLRRVQRPLVWLALVWLVIYVPLAVGLSAAFPEESYEVQLDSSELYRPGRTGVVYVDGGSDTRVTLILNDTVQQISVAVEEGYVPVGLTLQGYGMLDSTARFDANRTWPLSDEAAAFLCNTSAVWTVKVVEKRTDVLFYRARGEALLEGKLLYRDVYTATPPLINLFWLLPVSLGGSFLVFRLYFACFAFLLSWLALRLRRDGPGLPAALFLLCNPLTVYSTLFGVQDDVIVALLYGAGLFLLVRRAMERAAGVIGLGMACKLWSVLLLPVLLSGSASWRNKGGWVAIAGGITAAVIAPFALVAPDAVAAFLRLYILGEGGPTLEGISLWRYLGEVGLDPVWLVPVLAIAGGALLWLVVHHRAGKPSTALLFLLLFLLLFPKIHSGYYVPLLLFVPLLWGDKHVVGGIAVAVFGVIALDGWNWLGWSEPVLVPLLLAVGVWFLLAGVLLCVLRHVRG